MSGKTSDLRVFVDTNVLFSAVIIPNSLPYRLLDVVQSQYRLLICTYSLHEISHSLRRKRPEVLADWDGLLSWLRFELIHTPDPDEIDFTLPPIRDEGDIPILASALIAKPDAFVSGDKDFQTSEIHESLPVYTPANFMQQFGSK